MDYMSTLEGLKGFLNALARCSEHAVGAWAIPYRLVQVRGSWEMVMFVNKAPCSLSVNYYKHAIWMDYMSILETFERFSNALGRHSVGAWAIFYLLVHVEGLGNCLW